ncbi:VPS13D [Mytilus coruscus]|uniref:VPS13D n=1 Tax=Mytilus coruscus TaxID=42192 RepID=A0A6J7ZW44_MYTCO|nr:VPS13D [Mytilus coruscus]
MLEGLAAWVLNTYIGEYVENLNTAQLSIALLQGAVELENLPLKKDALKYLDLPLQVKSGFIGKITLQIPIRYLRSEPWVISIEKLYLVAGPYRHTQFDEEKTKKDEQKKKVAMLEALEKEWKIQKQEKHEAYGSSWFSYGTSIASNILENIQLKIKDVHIRYEDDQLIPSCPFAFGIAIKSLSAVSTNGKWEMKFVSHDETNMMHKRIDLENFSVYLDTHATMLGNTHATMLGSLPMSDLSDALEREMFVSKKSNLFQDHEFILAPISAQTKLKRNTSALPLRSANMPRIDLNMNLDDINFCLSEEQYRCIIQWLKEIERHDKRRKCKRSCPTQALMKSPRKWWKYAISVHQGRIKEKNEHRTWKFAAHRVHDILLYYKAYTIYLIGEQLNPRMTADKNRIEEEFSFEELRIIRDLAYRQVKEKGTLFKAPQVIEKPQQEPQQKGYLQSWFPGWGGWYGGGSQPPTPSSSATSLAKDVGEPPPSKVIKKEEEEEIENEIMEVIQETSENTSFLKKDMVFALMHFTLNSGSFKLLCPKLSSSPVLNEHPANVTMVELECSLINMMFESRPRSSAMKYGLSLGSLYLRDKITENSSFPCLLAPQTRERKLSLSGSFSGSGLTSPRGSKSSGQANDNSKDLPQNSKSTDSFFKTLKEEKLFELMYEKNPTSTDASYKLSINTKPLDLVYNPATVRRVRDFFSSRNKAMAKVSKLQLTAEARRRYEVFKEQTKAELRNTLDQILAGDESIKTKKWVVDLDISAPQIMIPENFVDNAARMVVLDLGHLHLYNKNFKQRQDSDVIDEEEFQTPPTTPPSAEEAEETPSLTHLTEAEIYDKLYDRYTLELSDLQVMVGRARDNWKLARNRGSSHLHVIDKFTISLQFEKRLVYTTDPQYPSTTMTATLPCLNFHINEHKVSALRNCVNIIMQPSYSNVDLSGSASSSFSDTVDTDRTQAKQNPDSGKGFKKEDKSREMDEFTRLMIAQFSINTVSLEIQSRGRPIAELQVTKVKANMIKRPYDTAVGLTVHSLLVVDALQTYGHDFELLIASHRGVRLDSKSGSIMGSDPASPMSPTSPQSPRSPAEMTLPTPTTSLQSVQEAISKAFKSFVTGDKSSTIHTTKSHHSSGTLDVEAIVRLDLEIIDANSPSNKNGVDVKIANLQFSNLDIIANQETMVELISFVKQISPSADEIRSPQGSNLKFQPAYASQLSLNRTFMDKGLQETTSKLDVTADFHKLNILLMRLESIKGCKQARKVATFTMSSAQLQATIGNELDVTGSLGGFHVIDVTPDADKHYHIFSVGSEDILNTNSDSVQQSVMYKTAHESMFETSSKALQFSFIKGVQPSTTMQDFTLDTSQMSDNSGQKLTSVNVQMASMCYIHSPRLLNEVTQCVSEFTDFMKKVGASIKTAASEVAKGIMTKKSDMSMLGSTTGLDFTKSNLSINSDDEMAEG